MKWPLFENKIKDELSSHRSEVDIDALWSAIEPEVDALNQSKRKRPFVIFWFLLAGVLMLGGGIGGYYFLNNDKTTEKTIIAGNNSEEKTIEEKHDQNLNTNKATNNTQEEKEETVKIIDNQSAVNTAKNSLINNNKLKNEKNQTIEKKNADTPKSNDSKNLKNNQKTIANNDSHFEISEIQENDKTAETNISETIPKEKTAYLIPIKKLGTLAIPLFKIQTTTPQLDIQDLKNELAGDATSPTPPDEKRHPMDKKDFRFAIGAFGGISYANRSLSMNDGTANDLLKLRESSEKQLETTHAGLQFSLRHRSGFELATGLQYTRMVERFNYNENITELDSIDGVLYYAVNPNNDTLAIMGTVPHTTITDIRKEYYNKYTMFDIPVFVGYFKEKDEWSFGAQAGVFANISLKTEGQFLNSATTSTDIKDLFKSSVGLSYYVGASINHKLNENIGISISPYFRYFPKNFAKSDYGISQKYTLIGINARINYWF